MSVIRKDNIAIAAIIIIMGCFINFLATCGGLFDCKENVTGGEWGNVD